MSAASLVATLLLSVAVCAKKKTTTVSKGQSPTAVNPRPAAAAGGAGGKSTKAASLVSPNVSKDSPLCRTVAKNDTKLCCQVTSKGQSTTLVEPNTLLVDKLNKKLGAVDAAPTATGDADTNKKAQPPPQASTQKDTDTQRTEKTTGGGGGSKKPSVLNSLSGTQTDSASDRPPPKEKEAAKASQSKADRKAAVDPRPAITEESASQKS